jgi:ribosome maturation factor RimP
VEVVMTGSAQSTVVLAIGELVEPLVTAAGLELWDVEINPRAVRVLVDRPGGVDLESISSLARVVSAALDDRDDVMPSSQYQLEVSSPGVERTLRTPAHFQRFIGTLVAVKTEAPIDVDGSSSRRIEGELLAADGSGVSIAVSGGVRELPYEQIQKARTVLVWGPAAKTSNAKKKASARSEPIHAESATPEVMRDLA